MGFEGLGVGLAAPESSTVTGGNTSCCSRAEDRLAIGGWLPRDGTGIRARRRIRPQAGNGQRVFGRLVVEAKVPPITLHGTRHTWATLALLEGIPAKVVAKVLGHSSTQVTLDVYSHVDAEMQADATSRVAGRFQSDERIRRGCCTGRLPTSALSISATRSASATRIGSPDAARSGEIPPSTTGRWDCRCRSRS